MGSLDEQTVLSELRAMRDGQKADAEKLHSRINEVRESVIRMETRIDARPCPAHQARMDEINERVIDLESNQKKALIGWGVASMGVAAVMSGVWAWLKTKLGW